MIKALLSKPGNQATLLLGVEKQGFNTSQLFEELLELKAAFGNRLDLGVVPPDRGILHAKALLALHRSPKLTRVCETPATPIPARAYFPRRSWMLHRTGG